MDMFGKQAQLELKQLQKEMHSLELRYLDSVAKHNRITEDLRKSTELIATINAAKMSKVEYENEIREYEQSFKAIKREYEQKADDYENKLNDISLKEAEISALHETKKTSLNKEIQELKNKVNIIKEESSVFQKLSNTLNTDIQSAEINLSLIASKIEILKSERSKAESSLNTLQNEQTTLSTELNKLLMLQEVISNNNKHLNQVVSRLNRQDDENTVFASLEHDLVRFLAEDQSTGYMQVNLESKPLLLVIDMGVNTIAFALMRATLNHDRKFPNAIIIDTEARKILTGIGALVFEERMEGWLQKYFVAAHPTLKNIFIDNKKNDPLDDPLLPQSGSENKKVKPFISLAERLFALLCLGAPQGDIDESIVIDSQCYTATVPLVREELTILFRPLLGSDGVIIQGAREFLTENKRTSSNIDRIICTGMFNRLPLLHESLSVFLSRPVLLPAYSLTPTVTQQNEIENELTMQLSQNNVNVSRPCINIIKVTCSTKV